MSETVPGHLAAPDTDTLHLGCGEDTRPHAHNVDIRDESGVDETHDLDSYPWPWPDASFLRIEAEHVFEHLEDVEQALRECARLLKPGGSLRTVWPVGQNAWLDPDHKRQWHWGTPERYCGQEGWDVDVGLSVISKDAHIGTHFDGVAKFAYGGLLRVLARGQGPGRWLFDMPATSGEFEVVFQK